MVAIGISEFTFGFPFSTSKHHKTGVIWPLFRFFPAFSKKRKMRGTPTYLY